MRARSVCDPNTCAVCLTVNPFTTYFCVKCGAPVSDFAVIGPAQTPLAEGFIYRQAAYTSGSKLALTGMWLLFGPGLVGLLALPFELTGILSGVPSQDAGEMTFGISQIFGVLLYGLVSAALLYKCTRSYFTKGVAAPSAGEPEENP
jgi:hypothetical protein